MHLSGSQLATLVPLLAVLSPALAQDGGGSGDQDGFTQQFTSALQQAGFSQLASVVNQLNGSDSGQQLLSQISTSGQNFTLFAPSDQALQNLPEGVSGNQSRLVDTLSYHFVHGNFQNTTNLASGGNGGGGGGGGGSGTCTRSSDCSSSTGMPQSSMQGGGGGGGGSMTDTTSSPTASATGSLFKQLFGRQDNSSGSSGDQPYSGVYPNVTIGRTLLNSSDLVQLEGNKSQVLVWTRSSEQGNITILNQASNSSSSQNITVVNSTSWQNFFINGVDGVFIPPGNIQTALEAVNATAALSLAQQAQLPQQGGGNNESALQVLNAARGITIFVPNNDAFTSQVNDSLQGIQNNNSALAAIIENHYINGSTLYSTQIEQMIAQSGQANATTAAGEPLTFSRNDTGLFVSGNNGTTAQVVRPDVLIQNGVVHIVDGVFFNDASDADTASSAYESASESAAQVSTTETGPVGGLAGAATTTGTDTQSTQTSSSSSESSSTESSSGSQSETSSSTSAQETTTGGSGTLRSRIMANDASPLYTASLTSPIIALAALVAGTLVLAV